MHARAVGGRRTSSHRGPALHGAERPDLHAAGDPAADLRLRLRPEGDRPRRPDRRRVRQHDARRRRWSSGSATTAAATSRPGRLQGGVRRRRRTRAPGSRTRSGPTRACPASCPRCCPRRSTSSRRPSWSPQEKVAEAFVCGNDAGRAPGDDRQVRARRASTRSTWPTPARTTRVSSTSTRTRSCPSSHRLSVSWPDCVGYRGSGHETDLSPDCACAAPPATSSAGRPCAPGSSTAMRALLRGRDALVVMPTGAGKSAIYQVPATLLPGPTVVISPLLALQQDQIGRPATARRRRAAGGADQLGRDAHRAAGGASTALRDGRGRVPVHHPGAARRPGPAGRGQGAEAGAGRRRRGALHLRLGPRLPARLPGARPPHPRARPAAGGRADRDRLAAGARRHRRPGSACASPRCWSPGWTGPTCSSRRPTARPRTTAGGGCSRCCDEGERAGHRLRADPARRRGARRAADRRRLRGGAYHGGMAGGAREKLHEEFLADKVPIMVATSAFGMGIDKPNIRWVAHVALPDSPDSYLQEIGRAGRDGEPARALLLWRAEDDRRCSASSPAARRTLDELRDLAAAAARRRAAHQDRPARDAPGSAPASSASCSPCWSRSARPSTGAAARSAARGTRPQPGRRRRGRGRRGRAAADRAAVPHRHDARRRRDDRRAGARRCWRTSASSCSTVCGHCDNCARRPRGRRRRRGRAVPGAQHGPARRVGRRHGDGLRGGPDDGALRRRRLQDAVRAGRARTRACWWPRSTRDLGCSMVCDGRGPRRD